MGLVKSLPSPSSQVRFAFAIPTRNSWKTAKRALASLAYQSHHNWRAIIVDDCSVDDTPAILRMMCKDLGIFEKVEVVENVEREWEVANVLKALKRIDPDEVACRLDLDDYLCDLNALEVIAMAYATHDDLDALWTNHRWVHTSGVTNHNISAALPASADPYAHPWVSSHLKTWRKSVSDRVPDANYRGADGGYIKRAGDQAVYLPVLKLARRRLHCPITAYAYSCDMSPSTFQSEDAKFQKEEAEFLRKRGFVE